MHYYIITYKVILAKQKIGINILKLTFEYLLVKIIIYIKI